jgi:hypothetical protein
VTAQEVLKKIAKIDLLIANKYIERDKALAMATSTTAPINEDKVKSTPNPHRMSDKIDEYSDYDREIEALKEKKRSIIALIERLPIFEYDLLHKVYIQGIELMDIAITENKSYSWALWLHKKALQSFQKELDASDFDVKSLEKLC